MHSFTVRKSRLEKRIGKIFSHFLLYEVDDQRLKNYFVSVTKVKLNDELSRATIFFRILDDQSKNKVIKLLYKLAPFFMTRLRKKLTMRKLPEIRFINDLKYEKSRDVLELIDEISHSMSARSDLSSEK